MEIKLDHVHKVLTQCLAHMKHSKALIIINLWSYLWNRISKSTKREYDSKSSHFPQRADRLEGAAGGRTALAGSRAPARHSWAKKTTELQRRGRQRYCHSEGRQGECLRPGAVL